MPTVKRLLVPALLVAALALVPGVAADEPEDAPALWTELYGDDGVESLVFTPPAIEEGEHFEAALTFTDQVNVSAVQYQICYIGQGCFAIGVPASEIEPGTWQLDTREINDHQGFEKDIYFQRQPKHDPTDTRVGIQFFVCTQEETPCAENPFEWKLFPQGREGCIDVPDDQFKACEETHYFGINIQESRSIPSVTVPAALVVLAAVAVLARRR